MPPPIHSKGPILRPEGGAFLLWVLVGGVLPSLRLAHRMRRHTPPTARERPKMNQGSETTNGVNVPPHATVFSHRRQTNSEPTLLALSHRITVQRHVFCAPHSGSRSRRLHHHLAPRRRGGAGRIGRGHVSRRCGYGKTAGGVSPWHGGGAYRRVGSHLQPIGIGGRDCRTATGIVGRRAGHAVPRVPLIQMDGGISSVRPTFR